MAREEIAEARIAIALAGLELGVALHGGEEAHRAVGIETGARCDADADAVGLEFLRAREACQRQLRFRQSQRAELRVAEHVSATEAIDDGLPRLIFADRGVAGDHVRHLVRQHGGELGLSFASATRPREM